MTTARILNFSTRVVATCALFGAVAHAQVTIFSENFNAGLSPGANFSKYVFGDTDLATSSAFYSELLRTFKAATPLVRFLNAPLQQRSTWTP